MCTDLLQGCILFVNAVAILNNDRFLEKSKSGQSTCVPNSAIIKEICCAVGWGYSQIGSNNLAAHPNALKSQLIGGLHAVAYLRGMICKSDCSTLVLHQAVLSEHVMGLAVPLIVVNTIVILVKLVFG